MSGQEIAALIVAVTGAIAAILAGLRNLRGDKFRKDVEASAALLTGYTTMVSTLQGELERVKREHAEVHQRCENERERLRKEHHADVMQIRSEHRVELLLAYERIDDLSAQVYTLVNRPPESKSRRGDPE